MIRDEEDNHPEMLDGDEIFEIEITDLLDLHAFKPGEVKRVTEAYLEEAVRLGFPLVRIVHGKGIGVQREIVRKVLMESPCVKSYKDAPEFSGGHGATIAVLKQATG
jgi:dsDNA-specific endonuclease/ATPase MutS2